MIVKKVWGKENIVINDKYCMKIMNMKKDYISSYHCHKKKTETFYVIEGILILRIKDIIYKLKKNQLMTIFPNEYHEFYSPTGTLFIECSSKDNPKDSYRKSISRKIKRGDKI